MVLRQNGNFYGLYVMVENIDDAFLERHGFDPAGPLFKAVHWKYSNLRPGAATSAPCTYAPDWDWSWGPCPEGRDANSGGTNTFAFNAHLAPLLLTPHCTSPVKVSRCGTNCSAPGAATPPYPKCTGTPAR